MKRFGEKFKNVNFRPKNVAFTLFGASFFSKKMDSVTFLCLLNPNVMQKIRKQ